MKDIADHFSLHYSRIWQSSIINARREMPLLRLVWVAPFLVAEGDLI
jgi:hypothetical protein